MKKLSVLQKFQPVNLIRKPFPYLVIYNALPNSIYRELSDTYPSDSFILQNDVRKKTTLENAYSNARYQISAASILNKSVTLTPLWEDFIAFHTSSIFLQQVLDIFEKDIRILFPDFEKKMNQSMSQFRSGIRNFQDNSETCDIAMDCQVGINTRVKEYSRVTGPHCDSPEELYAGLFYMRPSYDQSTGGDLSLYKWKSNRRFYSKAKVEDKHVTEFAKIPYSANCFALILNSEDSVHGVTPRSVTDVSRRLVNIIAEVYPKMPQGLFKPTKTYTQNALDWFKSRHYLFKK